MNTASTCLDRMKLILDNRTDTVDLDRFAPADTIALFDALAPDMFRVSTARWMAVTSLLWNLENLRPALRERFETDLAGRCQVICAEKKLGSVETPETDEPQKEPDPAPEPIADTQAPAEKTVSPGQAAWAFGPGTADREDFFDKFIGWIAALVS